MTRVGKIARLPGKVREQLNRRLQNGEKATGLKQWLNRLPEVRAVLKAEFGGKPISDSNLTEWKGGGYRDWLIEEESLAETRLLVQEAGQFQKLDGEDLSQRLALWLTVRCAVEARKQRASGADPDLGGFGRLCRGLASLRRGEHSERRLKIEEARLKLEEKRLELSRGEGSETLEKMFWEWTERPDIKKKLRPRPLTKKQQMKRIRDIYGIGTYEEAPRVTTRRQIGNRLFEIETRMKELNEQRVELERRKAEEDRQEAEEAQSPKSEAQSREGSEDEGERNGAGAGMTNDEGQMTKEARMTKSEGNPKSENQNPGAGREENPPAQGFGAASEDEEERSGEGHEQEGGGQREEPGPE